MQCLGHLMSSFHYASSIFPWFPEIPSTISKTPFSVFGPSQIAWDLVLGQAGDEAESGNQRGCYSLVCLQHSVIRYTFIEHILYAKFCVISGT